MPKPLLPLLCGALFAVASSATLACGGRLHLGVGPSGVYHLDYASAVAAQPGLANCPVDELVMEHQGQPVPLRVLDHGDGVFNAGDGIEWIGEQLHGPESWNNPYSHINAYELGAAPGTHPRFVSHAATAAAAPALMTRHVHLEQDLMMMRLKTNQVRAGELPDVWFWAKLTMIDPAPFKTGFDLPDLAAKHPPITLRIGLRGWSSVTAPRDAPKPADHVLEVELNGSIVATLDWNGDAHVARDITLPGTLLRAKGNELRLKVPQRTPAWANGNPLVDVVMFDYLDFEYALDRADATAPFRIVKSGSPVLAGDDKAVLYGSDGGIYTPDAAGNYASAPAGTVLHAVDAQHAALTPVNLRPVADTTDWRQPAASYDYIIIAYPTLVDAIRPLAEFHREQGRRVAVIDVDALYDQFNHGVTDPHAIRRFLDHARQHWPAPKPHYVLLVGDASFDISDHRRDQKFYSKWTDRELLFPGQFGTIPGTEYAAKDVTPAERNLIPTFQYYSAEGQSASDNGFVDFGPDDTPTMAIGRLPVIHPDEVTAIVHKTIDYVRNPDFGPWRQSTMFITDDNTGFQSASNKLAEQLGAQGFSTDLVYPQSSDKDNLAHQKAIRDALDQGQLLVHFLGHGGRYIWRTGPPDPTKNHDLFTLDDVGHLTNAGRLPMVLSMTCYTAPFDNPTEDSIGERFLREPKDGAIAVFAASWRNWPDADFSGALLKDLLKPGIAIGDAILAAKQHTKNQDMLKMYNLLGDPALALQRPRDELRLYQVPDRWAPGVAVQIPGAGRFHGKLRVEWLDAAGKLLSRHDYQIDGTLFTLRSIPAGAHEVRAYALDASRKADAVGGLTLAKPKPWRPFWADWHWPVAPKPLPPAADRIFGSNFGG